MITYEEIPASGQYWVVKVLGALTKSTVYIDSINKHSAIFKDHWHSKDSRVQLIENIVFCKRVKIKGYDDL